MPTTSVITLATQFSVKHRDVFGTESWNQTRDLCSLAFHRFLHSRCLKGRVTCETISERHTSLLDLWFNCTKDWKSFRSPWDPQTDVSENNGIPKSSILIVFSTINHPCWGFPPIFGNMFISKAPLLSSGSPCHRAPFGTPWCRFRVWMAVSHGGARGYLEDHPS